MSNSFEKISKSIPEIINFLEKFEINGEKIENLILKKNLVKHNYNIFLVNNNFSKNEIYKEDILFIKLKKILPSKFILNFIKENSSNILEVKNEKLALKFSYGKEINFEDIKTKIKLKVNYLYLIIFNKEIIGISFYNGKNFENIMNIGEYLKE